MTFRAFVFLMISLAMAPAAARGEAQSPPSLFDPARHMHVAEVKPGMTGYGLSVFKGTRIERFDVEVLSVLKNFNPQYDVVLIKCKGEYLQHTGSIAGMSGSPIYLKDDEGRFRMIGAFAYGWPLTKDPVAGVQPIEYMLRLPAAKKSADSAEARAATQPSLRGDQPAASGRSGHGLSWSLTEAEFGRFPHALPSPKGLATAAGAGEIRLQPLATPLMASGLPPRLMKQVAPLFEAYGMAALQAGGGSAAGDEPVAPLEPGSVLAVPLLSGDMEMTAIGTVTEVLGDRVFGFGHPFNNEGSVVLPMGSGTVNGVIPNLQTSFKLGALTREQGVLTADESVGVAGQTGEKAPTVPLEFTIERSDGSAPRTYHFRSALHPKFTPLIAGVALGAAVTGVSELPQYNTLEYDLKLEFANGQTLDIANTSVNVTAQELFAELGLPMMAASENPFERVPVRQITGTVKITAEAREAQILEVNVPRSKYRPGETVKAFVTYKPFRGEEGILPVEMELPRDLPQGTYQLIISDAQRYFQDEQQSRPFRFTAENVRDVFAVLKDMASIRENAVYLRLLRQPDGVAVGRVAMPQLPSSRRQILLGAGRSNTTAFVSSTIKVVPTQMVMSGAANFAITIDPQAHVEVPGPKPAKLDFPAAPQKSAEPAPPQQKNESEKTEKGN